MKMLRLAIAVAVLATLFVYAVPSAFAWDYSACANSEEECFGSNCCPHAEFCCVQTGGVPTGECTYVRAEHGHWCEFVGCLGGTVNCDITR